RIGFVGIPALPRWRIAPRRLMRNCNTVRRTRRRRGRAYRSDFPQAIDGSRNFSSGGCCRERILSAIVVAALQPPSRPHGNKRDADESQSEGDMLAYLAAEGRRLGFDRGDWLLLVGAFPLVAVVTLLS